ncbi:branched-chain amino acid ABC transporter permease [Rhodobacteraceae bacterium NNCM2]|nr:branched-chain amino acid ABC transporter permease [Coraliihabitans acroporae]
MTAYLLNVLVFICVNGVLAVTLNFILGYAGIFSLAHAAFFGIGAYIAANMALHVSPDLFLGTFAAIAVCMLLSVLLALPALRVRGEYFVAASLGLQIIAVTVFSEWDWATGGLGGLVGIPSPTIFGIRIVGPMAMAILGVTFLLLITLAIAVLVRTSLGRSLMAIRDSESAALAFGKRISAIKVLSVAISAGFAAVGGVLYAYYVRFVNVESFMLDTSILLMAMVIIGGTGSLIGPILGALMITSLPPLLSYVPYLPPQHIGSIQQIIYGMAMILFMVFQPAGLIATFGKWGGRDAK